jgi:GNAT superfamily N-acetyltransferase
MRLTLRLVAHEDVPSELLEAVRQDPHIGHVFGPHKSPKPRVLIERGKTTVGFFTPRATSDLFWRPTYIYVLPEHRRKGIAKAALQKWMKNPLKPEKAYVVIGRDNGASQALFGSLGFSQDPDDPGRWTKDLTK